MVSPLEPAVELPPEAQQITQRGSQFPFWSRALPMVALHSYSRHGAREPLASSLQLLASSKYQYSNRHTYEKLEVGLTLLPSTKVLFLIDTKMHFIQGENAQSQCSPPPKEGVTITS